MTIRRVIPVLILILLAGCASDGKKTPTAKEAARKQWQATRAGVLYGLAKQQYATGNFDACRKSIDEAVTLDGENVQIHVLSARLSIEQGQLEQAEKELQTVRTLDPKMPEAYYLSGVVFQRWQKPEVALDFYEKALALAPAELPYLLAKAEMLVALDRLPEALSSLQEKLVYFENSAAIRDAVGQLLMQQQKYAEAAKVLRQASILAADEMPIREHLALALYYARDHREAAVILERLSKDERYSSRADLLLALGECQLQIDRPREARDSFEAAAQLQPGMMGAWLGLGKVAMQLDDLRRADLAARRAMAMEPANADANLLLGYLRLRQNNLDEAFSAFRKASALDPKDPTALCMCGYVLEKRGQSAEAMQYYAKALQIKPNDELATTLMANVHVND